MKNHCEGPNEYIKEYDKFIYLIDGRAEEEINAYITESHTFEEFSSKVTFFNELGKTLNDSLPKGELYISKNDSLDFKVTVEIIGSILCVSLDLIEDFYLKISCDFPIHSNLPQRSENRNSILRKESQYRI